ncbi:MAG: ComEA family DNA-binding protein [Dehalococcoidia bacterium]
MSKIRLVLIIGLLIAIIAGGVVLILKLNTASYPIEITLPTPSQEIEVYVSGAVQTPGLYVVNEKARVADAIDAAGGFTPDADQEAVNLARSLRDGAQIQVPRTGESSQLIDINTAEAWLLTALPGIGDTLAERIMAYRVQSGPFESIDDLKKVEGIRDATYEKLKDKITVR